MSKHAYLIMAHNNFNILNKLISSIDDERNDIYIHIDSKVNNFDFNACKNLVMKSNLFFIDRMPVYWGDYSMVQCEYALLHAAKDSYEYYHLLSGVDLPLKNQDEIHEFFDKKEPGSLVQFVSRDYAEKVNAFYRLKRYKFFQKYVRSNNLVIKWAANLFQNIFMPMQTLLRVDRTKGKSIKVGFGAQWVSLCRKDYLLVLEKEKFVQDNFKHTLCPDEIFIQTILLTYSDEEIVYDADMSGHSHGRFIDWERGNPYVFRSEDYNLLINSSCLFARKFDERVDMNIVYMLYKHVKK